MYHVPGTTQNVFCVFVKAALYGCVVLCTGVNFVFGDNKSTWSIQQFDGLDDLYIETEKKAPITPDYARTKKVCNKIKKMDSFHEFAQIAGNFHSKIRGRLKKVKRAPLYVAGKGFRRYKFKTKEKSTFTVDLYWCADPRFPEKFGLSFGYQRNSIFFLFLFDCKTNEAELKGLVHRDTVREDVGDVASSTSVKNHSTLEVKPENDALAENPVCNVNRMQKFQACLLLLNTPYYTCKYTLSLTLANINQACKRVIVEEDWSTHKRVERYAFPCWVRPISNPWVKIFNLPDEPSRPLYLYIDINKLRVHAYRTVEQGDEYDIVRFDANLRTLLLKDLFFIFKYAASGLKRLARLGKSIGD